MIFAVGDQAVAELADLRDALIQLARTRLSSRQVQVMIIVLCGDDDDDNGDDGDDDDGKDGDDDGDVMLKVSLLHCGKSEREGKLF